MNFRKIKTVNNIPITLGLVVWCHLDGYPWWPAVVVNREEHEPKLDPGESLPPESEGNRLVEFFNDDKRVSVVDLEFLREYTSNIHLCRQSTKLKNEVHIACEEANTYIETRGLEKQKSMYEQLDSFELLKKGSLSNAYITKRRSIAEPTQDDAEEPSAPFPSKRRSTSKYRRPAEAEDSAKEDQIDPVPRDASPPAKRRKFKDNRSDGHIEESKTSTGKKARGKSKKTAARTSVEKEESEEMNEKELSHDGLPEESRKSLLLKKTKERDLNKSSTDAELDSQAALISKNRKKVKAERKAAKLEKKAKGKSRSRDKMKIKEGDSKSNAHADADVEPQVDHDAPEESKSAATLDASKEPEASAKSKTKPKLQSATKQKLKLDVKPKAHPRLNSKSKTDMDLEAEAVVKSESKEQYVPAELKSKANTKKSKGEPEAVVQGKTGARNRRQYRDDGNRKGKDNEHYDVKPSKLDVDTIDKPRRKISRYNSDRASSGVEPRHTTEDSAPNAEHTSDVDNDENTDDEDRPGVETRDVAAVMAEENPKDSDVVPYEDLDRVDLSNIPSVDETLAPTSGLKVEFEDLQENVVKFVEGLQDIAYLRDILKKKMEQTKQVRIDVHRCVQKLKVRNLTVEQLQATQVGGKIVSIIERTWENSPFLAEELVPLAESWSEIASKAEDTTEASKKMQQAKRDSSDLSTCETPEVEMTSVLKPEKSQTARVDEKNRHILKSREEAQKKVPIKRKPLDLPSKAKNCVKPTDEGLVSKSVHAVKLDEGEPGKIAEGPVAQSLESSNSQRRGPSDVKKRRRSEDERIQNFDPSHNRNAILHLLQRFKLEQADLDRLVKMFLDECEIRANGNHKLYFAYSKKIVVQLKSKNAERLFNKALKDSNAGNFFE